MSGYTYRDKSGRRGTRHTYWCQVDGGTGRHGIRGFVCPRCAETPDRTIEALVRRAELRVRR